MRILALETTERIGSLAVADDGNLLSQLELDPTLRTAQSLAPGIKTILEAAGWKPADVELVAVTVGPGSFTGLRLGIATAKTFAYAVGAEVLGIDTLEAIAAAAPDETTELHAAVDAQRGQVVAAAFQRDADGWMRAAGEAQLLDADAWLAALSPGSIVTGPIIKRLVDRLPEGVTALPSEFWPPKASQVALLAARDHKAGRRDDLWGLLPRYSRLSAAEEKLQKRG